MAGVIAKRLRLTTSRKPSYRRAGVKIGTISAPTYLEPGDVELEQALAILRDPNIVLAFDDEEGGVQPLTSEERAEAEEGILAWIEMRKLADPEPSAPAAGSEPDTSGPQGGGSDPDAEASKASGPEATADASDGSAADAGTAEPEKPAAADPAPSEPAPAPAPPTSSGGRKPKTVKGKS